MNDKCVLPNEQAAERVTNIAGWVCKTCRTFYGDEGHAERAARYCCEKDHACGADGCQGRAEKPWIYCKDCNSKRDLARYLALPEVAWDGETPLVENDDDEFFMSAEDLEEHLAGTATPLEHLRLVICEKEEPRSFDMTDHLTDYFPEDMDGPDDTKINALVNRWIDKHVPAVWTAGKTRPTLESLRQFVDETARTEE